MTPREFGTLRLVIEALVISPRTVDAHLRSIYGKLDVISRAAVTRFAYEHQLV